MPKIIEFKIPTKAGIEQARGMPVWLNVGDRRVKFMLQYNGDDKARYLTHFASGMRIGTLDDAAVELMCKLSPYHRFRNKELAVFLIQKAVVRMGLDKVQAALDNAPVIN